MPTGLTLYYVLYLVTGFNWGAHWFHLLLYIVFSYRFLLGCPTGLTLYYILYLVTGFYWGAHWFDMTCDNGDG